MHEKTFHGVAEWIELLRSMGGVSGKVEVVLRYIAAHPQYSSYASVRDIAAQCSVSMGTVTRAARAVGFSGWTPFQEEIRATYISSLSAREVSEQRAQDHQYASYSWLLNDRKNLNAYVNSVDPTALVSIARAIHQSDRTMVVADGSYAGIGQILAHTSSLYGYDVRLLGGRNNVSNSVAHLTSSDLIVAINFWKINRTSRHVLEACQEKGVRVVLIGEDPSVAKRFNVEFLRIPTESVGFSPSMIVALSVVQSIVAELAAIDPDRSMHMLGLAEAEWDRFGDIPRG